MAVCEQANGPALRQLDRVGGRDKPGHDRSGLQSAADVPAGALVADAASGLLLRRPAARALPTGGAVEVLDVVGFAFIGTGGVAQLHAEALRRIESARLIGAWSRSAQNVAAFAAKNGTAGYDSLEALLADPAVEAVAVLSPAPSHVEHALACLRAKKHVLIEKPIAATVGEIEQLKAAAAAAGRLCVPAHNYVYAPVLREAKRRITAGDLGRISSFWLIYNQRHVFRPHTAPQAPFRGLMIHHAYAAIYFVGTPLRVSASA
ncbi:MAG: Gfo/Idh/MocA family oxidoreductase, partial [Methylobacteriaceae bacterium]|nr:Gfo/Idh/MocA family oxidoreductase [Methylobacteriaceae bacterium]